jgi:agmatine deiminase
VYEVAGTFGDGDKDRSGLVTLDRTPSKVSVNEAIEVPPEWAPQKTVWTAWPADPREWNGDLEAPRRDVAALIRALAESGPVSLLVNGSEAEGSARAALAGAAEIIPARYGDIWLRDTGPIFARAAGRAVALRFQTNSWGGKFGLPDDATVGSEVARLAGVPELAFDFVLEGGAVDHDGQGTFLATRQTLLNANRNGWTESAAEAALASALGAKQIIWIDEGLLNDHTDGHIDNLARFAGLGVVVCQAPAGADDPNAPVLEAAALSLETANGADGRKLDIVRIPGPGRVRNALGETPPASHMNFIIANGVVAVPVYGTASQDKALGMLSELFPGRKVIGLLSHGLLGCGDAGGGSFHCITQQEPLL